MRLLKIAVIVIIVFAIFFIRNRNKTNNVLIILSEAFLAQTKRSRRYNTTQIVLLPITIAFFSDVKLSKKVCVYLIEHEPVILTSEETYFV